MMTQEELKEYQQYLKSQGLNDSEAIEYMKYAGVQVPEESGIGVGDVAKGALSGVARGLDYLGGFTRLGAAAVADPFVDQDLVAAEDFFRAARGQAPDTAQYLERAGVPEGASIDLNPLAEGETSVRDVAGFVGDVALDPLTYLSAGASALGKKGFTKTASALAKADKALNLPGELIAKGGKKVYKSGLKGIDQVAARFGKEPVSDLLLERGITGSATSIQKQMDEIADQSLKQRDAILREASETGAEVSMKEAMAPTIAEIQSIRAKRDPKLQPLADQLQAQVDQYLALDPRYAYSEVKIVPGKQEIVDFPVGNKMVKGETQAIEIVPPSWETIELPRQGAIDSENILVPRTPVVGMSEVPGRVIPGEISPAEFVQSPAVKAFIETPSYTEAGRTFDYVPGPSPMVASGYKTTLGAQIPDSAFREGAVLDAYTRANKRAQAGMREAVENTVGRSLGDEAKQTLIKKNDELGRLLTTREKQLAEAMKEQNKNIITSVDGGLLGAAPSNPLLGIGMFGAKKAADVGKTTWARTKGGKALMDLGNAQMTDPVLRQLYIQQMQEQEQSPYYQMPITGF